ncbi:MAG: TonB-dependent receptor [Nitrospira sp.]|nr:MAG: TonB-dependent receptor [Nitrospira sp.]
MAEESPPLAELHAEAKTEREGELLYLKEETVSIAMRYEQPISQAPSNVYVITDEDIRHSGATDIPTILRRVPGLEVMQTTGADFNVSVRGNNQLRANKLLVMVDGRSVFNDGQGFFLWKMLPVTLPEIERIEVLKGPASVVYGFNAFDGVINIITKSPEEMRGTTLQFGGGELGTITSAAIHAGTLGEFGYRLSVGRDQNQEWRSRDSLAFRSHKFNVQTGYHFGDGSMLTMSGGLIDANRFDGLLFESSLDKSTASQGYASVGYERPDFFIRSWWMQTTYNADTLSHPLLGNLFRVTDRTGGFPASYVTNTMNLEAQHSVRLGPMFRLIYGVNFRHNTLSSNFIIDGFARENRVGFYVQSEFTPTPEVTLIAGVRQDLQTFIYPTYSPRIALLIAPTPNHTFRAAFSVGYRPPTLFEIHADGLIPTIFDGLLGVPPLSFHRTDPLLPEQLVSYELGYQGWFWQHRLRLRADLFSNLIRDLVDISSSGPRQIEYENDNNRAKIYGGEVGLEFLATSWLTLFANYAYLKIDQTFIGTSTVAREGPRFKINAGARGEWSNGLSSSVILHHVEATHYPINEQTFNLAPLFGNAIPNRALDSYNLLNLRGAYRFWQQEVAAGYRREAEVAISAFNALNDQHKEHPLGDTIGSRVMGWLTVRF